MVETFDFEPKLATISARPVRIIIPTASIESGPFRQCLSHINEAALPRGSIITAVVSSGPGFSVSKSINAGFSKVSTEDILLLNDDCFIDPDTVKNIVFSLGEKDGVIGGLLRYEDGRVQHYGGVVKIKFISIFMADVSKKAPFYAIRSYLKASKMGTRYVRTYHYTKKNQGQIDYVTGALFYIRNEVYKIVGQMDETLVNDWEDLDYCLRVKKAGYVIRVQDNATAIHKEHASLRNIKQDSFIKLKVFNEKWGKHDLAEVLQR